MIEHSLCTQVILRDLVVPVALFSFFFFKYKKTFLFLVGERHRAPQNMTSSRDMVVHRVMPR